MTLPTFGPANSLAFTVQETVTFSKDQDQFLKQLTSLYEKLARAINARDIALYSQTELLNGQTFPGTTPQSNKNVFRKIFPFGAIVAGATLTFAHNIGVFAQFTRIYGTCKTALPDFRPIPFASTTLVTDQIEVTVDAANINIVNGATAPDIDSGFIILEYLKN